MKSNRNIVPVQVFRGVVYNPYTRNETPVSLGGPNVSVSGLAGSLDAMAADHRADETFLRLLTQYTERGPSAEWKAVRTLYYAGLKIPCRHRSRPGERPDRLSGDWCHDCHVCHARQFRIAPGANNNKTNIKQQQVLQC
jgi:hypothetical protein